MKSLIPELIVAGLGAAVSPIAVILLIAVFFRDHARRNSLLFLLGFSLTLLGIGVAIVAIFSTAGSGGTSKLDYYVDIALGALCLAFIPLALKKKPKPPREEAGKELKASSAFVRGIVAMLINSSTWVIYIAGLHLITAKDLDTVDNILAILILTFVTLLSLIIPIGFFLIFPDKSQAVLESFRTWLVAHNKIIGVGILLVFGLYLLIKGIAGVV